ncbi:MAG: hypothetical protein AAB322_08100, partial [Pseudomonadota bacterium]
MGGLLDLRRSARLGELFLLLSFLFRLPLLLEQDSRRLGLCGLRLRARERHNTDQDAAAQGHCDRKQQHLFPSYAMPHISRKRIAARLTKTGHQQPRHRARG